MSEPLPDVLWTPTEPTVRWEPLLTRAQKKLDKYDEIADQVLPLMEKESLTFGSALKQLGLWSEDEP